MLKNMFEKAQLCTSKRMFALCASGTGAFTHAPARNVGNGQSHILEIVVTILVVVVLGIFLYLTTVPEIKTLIDNAMSTIGTIVPN